MYILYIYKVLYMPLYSSLAACMYVSKVHTYNYVEYLLRGCHVSGLPHT